MFNKQYERLLYYCLNKAKVPTDDRKAIVDNLLEAKNRTKGLLLHKIKARLFKARYIAKQLPWEAERLVDYRPDLAEYDIAPIISITCNGDNANWEMTKEGARPVAGQWMSKDKNSADYQEAIQANYWCKGMHPRDYKARVAWYKRNAGEYKAYSLGSLISPTAALESYDYLTPYLSIKIACSGYTSILEVSLRLIGKLGIKLRTGYEITNVFNMKTKEQNWYAVKGNELKATVTHSILPTWSKHA